MPAAVAVVVYAVLLLVPKILPKFMLEPVSVVIDALPPVKVVFESTPMTADAKSALVMDALPPWKVVA